MVSYCSKALLACYPRIAGLSRHKTVSRKSPVIGVPVLVHREAKTSDLIQITRTRWQTHAGSTVMKRRQLNAVGYRLCSVPFWEWPTGMSNSEKENVLASLLSPHLRCAEASVAAGMLSSSGQHPCLSPHMLLFLFWHPHPLTPASSPRGLPPATVSDNGVTRARRWQRVRGNSQSESTTAAGGASNSRETRRARVTTAVGPDAGAPDGAHAGQNPYGEGLLMPKPQRIGSAALER